MTAPSPAVQFQGMGAISADNANTFTQTVISYAQLRTFPALSNMVVYAQGTVTAGDGGQSFFWYNSSIVNPVDNNATVIVPTGNIQGAWLALSVGQVQNLLVTGTLTVDGDATFVDPVAMDSTLAVAGVSTFASDIVMTGTGEIQIPVGTTAQRSGAPSLGDMRYNTSLGQFEGYGATGWAPLAGVITSGVFPSEISGLLPSSITGTSTTASLSVSTGKAVDTTAVTIMSLAVIANWAVTNGNAINGYQGGTTLPNSTTIHFFICQGASGTGIFASLSASTPTLPVGYATYFRRIFSIVTTAGGAPIVFTADEITGGGMRTYLAAPTTDIAGSTMTTANRTLYSLNVPSGIKVEWHGTATGVTANAFILTSPDAPDTAPINSSTSAVYDSYNNGTYATTSAQRRPIVTNTGGQLGARGESASALYLWTEGWDDFRRA